MIVFDFTMLEGNNSTLRKILCQSEYTYPEILKTTGKFRILVDDNVFFSEPYFPILEFLKYALIWVNCSDESKEMLYSSAETEDNPLLVFLKKENGWIIRSPWQLFECDTKFTKEDLAKALYLLKKSICL